MSGGMGYYAGDNYLGDEFQDDQQMAQQQRQQSQSNPLRDHLKKVEDQNTELQKQLASLLKKQRENEVADALQAKGYDRGAAALYGGEPEKLDEWLTSVGPLLAKQPAPTSGEGAVQQPGQPPASTVPADGQAAMQQMQQMGNMAAPPAGSDAEQMAQINNATDAQSLMQYLNSQGNPYHFNG